jgi:hypothetical protein
MGSVNQGTARIVIIVALVAVGAVVLANGFDSGGGVTAATPSGSETPSPTGTLTPSETSTPSATETPSPQQPSQVIFMALNGTDVTGLAAEAQQLLEDAGYTPAQEAGNTPTGGVQVTTVYYRGGANAAQNQSDAQYLADTFFEGAEVDKLGPAFDEVVPSIATVVVVVGQDYADLVAGGE